MARCWRWPSSSRRFRAAGLSPKKVANTWWARAPCCRKLLKASWDIGRRKGAGLRPAKNAGSTKVRSRQADPWALGQGLDVAWRDSMGMTVDEFVKAKVLPEYRDIVSALRGLMREYAPNAREEISYGK